MRTKPDPKTAAFGIDIGKKVFHVVALNAAEVIQRAKFPRDTLLAFFDAAPNARIGMEACPDSQWLARRLATMGHDARIIPARFVKLYVKSNKADTVDAAAIAEAVTRPTMRVVKVCTPEQVDLQARHRIRDRLVGLWTALINQARAFCLEDGLAMRVGAGGFYADIRRHLGNAENDLTATMRMMLADLATIEWRITAVTGKVEAYTSQHDAVSRLLTIPGIGAFGATAIIAAPGDGCQISKTRDLAAWLGLVPAERSTGGKQTLLGISKSGNRSVRRLIIHGARSCFLHLNWAKHALAGWLSALQARIHRNKAVVALPNKLTRIVWAILTRPGAVYLPSRGAAVS